MRITRVTDVCPGDLVECSTRDRAVAGRVTQVMIPPYKGGSMSVVKLDVDGMLYIFGEGLGGEWTLAGECGSPWYMERLSC